jgi:hypothetical protein
MRKITTTTLLLITFTLLSAQPGKMSKYNVVWHSPSTDASGQMPLGNGDVAAGAYALENDALYLLLSKNDAFTYNGDLFKTGRVKISISPNPFVSGKAFKQTLDLETASIRIEAEGIKLLIWADAHRNVYHVQVESEEAVSIKAVPEFWERNDGSPWNLTSEPIDPPTQDVLVEGKNALIWYYAVGDRSVFPTEMKYYDVEEMLDTYPDPYRFNTFGNLLFSPDLQLTKGSLQGSGTAFDIRIFAQSERMADTKAWIRKLEKRASQKRDTEQDWMAHKAWWTEFWDRSWIHVSDANTSTDHEVNFNGEGYRTHREEENRGALVAQNYNVFRFLMACQSRGRNQTKFNGGLFTQPLRFGRKDSWNTERVPLTGKTGKYKLSSEDYRDWGRRYTFQNQRLLYWPLFMSGDLELTRPFFNYYMDLLPIRKAITKAWFGHEGAYYRENIEPTGGERDCGRGDDPVEFKPLKTPPGENDGSGYYHSYYFTSGLEIVAMMLDYARYSQDQSFIEETLVPFSREVLLFFDRHYPRDEQGKLKLDPAMVLETFWIAVNPAPDVAGLHYCLDGLLDLKAGKEADITAWKRLKGELPEVHLHELKGRKAIAPAEEWSMKRNSENGELYPVFPFQLFGVGHGTKDMVEWTMAHRTNVNAFDHKCWTQDQIHWAYAGNAREAQEGLIKRFSHASTQCRFPLYGVRQPDSAPDFDHFGSGSTALQRMLVQEVGEKIHLLPAWPADWDADFKLHLRNQTVLNGKVVKGELVHWTIFPESRMTDVVIHLPQKNKHKVP